MNRRGMKQRLTGRMDLATQDLAPAYFALVMATGALSLAAQTMDLLLLSRVLFWFNVAFYGVLWILSLWRIGRFGRRVRTDLADYLRGPGFFSVVAGSAILGSQFVLLAGQEMIALLLWSLSLILWLALNYGLFTTFTIRSDKPSLEHGITGIWLLAVVAAQSLAVLAAVLDAHWGPLHRLEFNFIALSL